jgi:hypothetical protein
MTVHGARVPRELAHQMLIRMRGLVNGDRSPLVHLDGAGAWMVAIA